MKRLEEMNKAEIITFGNHIKEVKSRAILEAKQLTGKIGTRHEIRLHNLLRGIEGLDKSLSKAREFYKLQK
jgi:hypothetical protein